jgi:hypothetical protein
VVLAVWRCFDRAFKLPYKALHEFIVANRISNATIALNEISKLDLELGSASQQFHDFVDLFIRRRYDRVRVARHAVYNEQQLHLERILEISEDAGKVFQLFLP